MLKDKTLSDLASKILLENVSQISSQTKLELGRLISLAIHMDSMNDEEKNEIQQTIQKFLSDYTQLQQALALAFGEYFEINKNKRIRHFNL